MSDERYIKALGKALKYARQTVGLSRIDVGKESGIYHRTIATYEQGIREAPVAQLRRLCRAMGLPLAYVADEAEKIDALLAQREPT